MRRDGAWNKRDLNVELIAPFSGHIATSWCELFQTDFFGSFEDDVMTTVAELMKEIAASVPPYLQAHAKKHGDACMAEIRSALASIVPAVKIALQNHQKSISRDLAPHVQKQLLDGYRSAILENGRGSMKRQKVRVTIP